MNLDNVDLAIKNKILLIIYKHLSPKCKIFLFGSRAKNTSKEGADIDLALDAGEIIDLSTLGKIQEEIEESNIPVFVDLIDVFSVDKKFLNHIKSEWIEWKN